MTIYDIRIDTKKNTVKVFKMRLNTPLFKYLTDAKNLTMREKLDILAVASYIVKEPAENVA